MVSRFRSVLPGSSALGFRRECDSSWRPREFAMAAAIPLRSDFDAERLRATARQSEEAGQTRRLLALAVIYEGGSRSEAARVGGVTLQVVRDWVLRFNALGPAGLIDRKAPGQPPRLGAEHRAALAEI